MEIKNHKKEPKKDIKEWYKDDEFTASILALATLIAGAWWVFQW